MAGFVKRLQSFQGRGGVLSVSLSRGFPWGDVADNGARLSVITDNDEAGAVRLATQLGREFIEMRLGGKCGPSSGDPVDIRVTVHALREEHSRDVFGMRWPPVPCRRSVD